MILAIHSYDLALSPDVIPAQAGIHPEVTTQPQGGAVIHCDQVPTLYISGWTPACAGVTPSLDTLP